MTVEDYDPLFAGLKARLVPLLSKIMESNVEIPRLPEEMTFPADAQELFCNKVSKAMDSTLRQGGWIDLPIHSVLGCGLTTLGLQLGSTKKTHSPVSMQ